MLNAYDCMIARLHEMFCGPRVRMQWTTFQYMLSNYMYIYLQWNGAVH